MCAPATTSRPAPVAVDVAFTPLQTTATSTNPGVLPSSTATWPGLTSSNRLAYPPASVNGASPVTVNGNRCLAWCSSPAWRCLRASCRRTAYLTVLPWSSLGGLCPWSSLGGFCPWSSLGGFWPCSSFGGCCPCSSFGGFWPCSSFGGFWPCSSFGGFWPCSSSWPGGTGTPGATTFLTIVIVVTTSRQMTMTLTFLPCGGLSPWPWRGLGL